MQVPKNMLMPQNRCLLVKPFISRLGDLPALVNILHTGRNNNSKGNHQAKYFPCLAPIEEARAAKCAEPEVRAYREMRSPRVGPDTVSGVSCSITWLPSYTWTELDKDEKTWWDWWLWIWNCSCQQVTKVIDLLPSWNYFMCTIRGKTCLRIHQTQK